MDTDCKEHRWQHGGMVPIPDKDKGNILVIVLYCTSCSEVQTKLVPPPEISPIVTVKKVPDLVLR